MFETTPDIRHRDAIRRAHSERAAVVAQIWDSLFARRR